MREQQYRRMGLQGVAHRLDLGAVVVDVGVEPAAEDGPAQRGDEVDGEPAPSGAQLVEHLAGLLDGGVGNLVEPFAEPRGREHLGLDQPWRFVLRAQQAQLHPFDRQDGAPDHESGELALVLGDGRVAPLLAQFGDFGGLTCHHPRARRVTLENAVLQQFRWAVGVTTRQHRHHFRTGGQAAGHPEDPHRHDRPVVVGLEQLHELSQHRGGRIVVGGQFQHLDLRVGMLLALVT